MKQKNLYLISSFMILVFTFLIANVSATLACYPLEKMEEAKYVVAGEVISIKLDVTQNTQDYYIVKIKLLENVDENIRFGESYNYSENDKQELEEIKEQEILKIKFYKFNVEDIEAHNDAQYIVGEIFTAYLEDDNYGVGSDEEYMFITQRGICGKINFEEPVEIPTEETHGINMTLTKPDLELNNRLLFYFYSDTCPHCVGMEVVLDKIEWALDTEIIRINVIEDFDLTSEYKIKAVPSLVLVNEEGMYIKYEGRIDYEGIITWIENSEEEILEEVVEENEEELVEIPAKIEDKEVTYFCNGCLKDNRCYPIGYRKSGEYCSEDFEFIEQLEAGETCENNCECKSNVCVNSECISGSLIKRILNWFRKLFGREL